MTMAQIPTMHFDSQVLPGEMRFAAFRAGIPHYEVDLAEGGSLDAFRARSDATFLGDLILLRSRLTPLRMARTPARIQADGLDTYGFVVLLRGSWTARFEAGEAQVGPGQLVAVDLSRPFHADVAECEAVHLIVGRSALQAAVRKEFDIAGHVFSGTGGALLTDYLLSLARHIGSVRVEDVDAVRRATIAQIAAAVAIVPPPEAASPAVRSVRGAVQRYVDRNLTDFGLTPERIAEAIGISRSSLYRHFEAYGGIAAFLQRRRLQAVHALLLHPDEERSIGELAETFGFPRASHFTTAFRRTFGCTPRLLRTSSRRPLAVRSARDPAEAPAVLRDWVREISLR